MIVSSYRDMEVYQRSYSLALDVHKASLDFPKAEQYALSSQMRSASKGICANLAEGFAKNHRSSAEEMTVWVDFAKDLKYIDEDVWKNWLEGYRIVCKQLYTMIDKWKD